MLYVNKVLLEIILMLKVDYKNKFCENNIEIIWYFICIFIDK